MSEAKAILRLQGVEKRYGRTRALSADNLVLREGEFVLVVGSNGAGKTTLLRLMTGATAPDSGRVVRSGGADGTCAFVPQRGGLYGDLSLQENLALYSGLYGRRSDGLETAAPVRAMGLVPFLHRRFSDLSGGFQRLAVIAAALHVSPDLLFVDEPLSGLDHDFTGIVQSQLALFRSRGRLLVVSSPRDDLFPEAERTIRVQSGNVT